MTEDVRPEIDELVAQRDLDALLDQVEDGAEFLITREGKAVARLLAPRTVIVPTGAAALSASPAPGNLAEAIRRRFASVGGVDDLELPPREPHRDPPDFSKPVDGHMRHEDFRVGGTFWCARQRWRCTDIGTRVITAIKLDHEDDPSWYNGPPYGVLESVFNEFDIEGCTPEPDPDDTALPLAAAADTAETSEDAWDSSERTARQMAHARELRAQARAGGLRFDAYLPPTIADWLLAHIERGTFTDPSEAVFVMLGEQQELEPHEDLRREFLKRRIKAGMDSGPGIPADEVFARLRKSLAEPRPEPAVWRKQP